MHNLIRKLKSEPSTNKKLDILKSYSDDENIKEALKLTYDPFIRFYINKIQKRAPEYIPAVLLKEFNSEAFSEFKKITSALSERRVTGNDAKAMVHTFLDSCSDELRDAFILMLKKDLKAGISVKSLQKAFGEDFIEDFNVQLAHTYKKEKTYKTKSWYASAKLDGLRCYFTHGKLLTRNGHEILGFDHIIDELNVIAKKYKLDFVDGELFTTEVNFQEIQGAVMSNKNIDPERKSKIKYHIFAMGSKSIKVTQDMVDLKSKIFDENTFNSLIDVPYNLIENKPEVIEMLCRAYMQDGYEGIMLRDPIKWYDWKRSNALLKFKVFKEDDFKIVGFYEGELGTKLEGTLGGLVVEGLYNPYKDVKVECNMLVKLMHIKSEVGSGFSDNLRNDIWNNKDEYLGKMAEIKFQNITDNPDENEVYSLRFPVFLKTKEDR